MEAFDILADELRPMLLCYLKTLVGDASLAEDLAQETLLAAYKSLAKFRKGGNFGAWLRGIARNKAHESQRVTARNRVIVDDRIIEGMEDVYCVFDSADSEHGLWEERLTLLRRCIDRLSPHFKAAVVQVYQVEQSLEQASASLGVSFEAIAQRLSRARRLLFECVAARLRRNEA
jgi:RNA polymerase sigma-70 factor